MAAKNEKKLANMTHFKNPFYYKPQLLKEVLMLPAKKDKKKHMCILKLRKKIKMDGPLFQLFLQIVLLNVGRNVMHGKFITTPVP